MRMRIIQREYENEQLACIIEVGDSRNFTQ